MKKYILVVLGVFLCVSGAVAENIESVSFNPARLGRFERLKVSDTLSTKGALQTDAATINGGVTIENAGNYIITTTKANSMVELPDATLTPDTLNLYGGTATFSAASEIEKLEQNVDSGSVPANVAAATLAMTGHAITVTNGLTLGQFNRIPVPDNCSGSLGWYHLSTSDLHQRFSVLGCVPSGGGCTGASSRQCGCGPKFGTTYKYGTQTRTCVNGSWSAWSACTGHQEWVRQQCPEGGDEEWQCVASGSGYNWKQITACSGGGEEPKRYEWQLACYNAWHCCSYCPTSSAESQCRGSCTTPGESFQVDGWLYPDDPHGCVDGESCTCTCVEI
ncbi:hypothetical protein [Candidatus Avelusimicrobium sp.]